MRIWVLALALTPALSVASDERMDTLAARQLASAQSAAGAAYARRAQAVILQNFRFLNECVSKIRGVLHVKVYFEVDLDGSVAQSVASSSNPEADCVAAQIKTLRFPAAPAGFVGLAEWAFGPATTPN